MCTLFLDLQTFAIWILLIDASAVKSNTLSAPYDYVSYLDHIFLISSKKSKSDILRYQIRNSH